MTDPHAYRPAPGSIPESPGVYRFRDGRGRVIYVGKAKNLRARLNSYFADYADLHPRTQSMLTSAAGVDWTIVGTEVEALQLEYSWIKEFDPRFNVRYRDDKSYPYLAVTMDEEYPRVMVMRGARRRGTRYFGPYSHAWAIRETVDTLLRVFPVRTCSAGVFKRARQIGRPCLLGYIGKCSAPCVERISRPSTAAWPRSSATSWPARPPGSPAGWRPRCGPRPRPRSTSAPPGCATTSRPWNGRWRSRRSSCPTAPTATSSRSPGISSRPPSRCSTSAAAGSAASAGGWWTRSRTSATASSSSTS